MASFVGRRLLYLLPVLLAVSLLTFLIASLLPGDLAYTILGDQATPEKLAALRAQMGLDLPIWQRYGVWLWDVLHGNLGRSFRTGETVLAAVTDRLPVSLELMVIAEVLGLVVAIPLAILCAVKSGSALDRFLTGLAFGKLSLPSFMVAILLIYLFAVELNWLPATGWVPFAEDPVGNLRSFVLPALTLAFAEWPVLMRVLRSDMIATLQEDYIAMAKAKGLRPARILFVHALKPSSLTLVTVTGINIGRLIGGALIVETIFALPGIGRLLVGAIYTRDLIILQGVVLLVAAGFVIMNFIVDMLYAVAGLVGVLPLPSPTDMDMLERRAPASALHWLGTDGLGRDELARLIYGARISLIVGLCAPMIGVTIGGALGMLAGYFRGRFETLVVGSMDVLLAFPPLVLALAVTAYLGQSLLYLTCILGVLGIPTFMRVARAATLTLARREFVIAAQALGATHARILLRELLPHVLLPLLAFFLLGVAVTIVVEGALSFLGLGVPPPISSWGSMIGEGRESLEVAPRLAFMPAIAMFLTVLSFNLVGDTLRALTDPRQGAL